MKKNLKKTGQLDLFNGEHSAFIEDFTLKGEEERAEKQGADEGLSKKESRREFFIPISGFVWLYPEEILIINHPAFQRLGKIYQLGQTYYVYRGATHKRFEHALGTLHIAHKMMAALKYNHARTQGRGDGVITGSKLTLCEERFVRLGALLHDIGHIAAGHTIEDELGLIGKHDYDERITLIFESTELADNNQETLKDLIDKVCRSYVPENLAQRGLTASIIVRLLIRKPPQKKKDQFKEFAEEVERSNSLRLQVCRDMIGNTICADLLDYIYRDWYHIGKPKMVDERIIQYMEIRPEISVETGTEVSVPNQSDRFVISLGTRPKTRTDAISSILDLLESRYQLAESVLFHRTKLSASAMLDRALYEYFEGRKIEERFFISLGDEELIAKCKETIIEEKRKKGKDRATSLLLFDALEKRQLYKTLCTYKHDDLPSPIRSKVLRLYAGDDINEDGRKTASENRINALRVLEKDFGLPPGSLVMYCPQKDMNSKIAKVKIAVDHEIASFDEYEEVRDNPLSGGHLDAQIKRFERLWGIYFFINTNVKNDFLFLLDLLREAIEKLVVGYLRHEETEFHASLRIASCLTTCSEKPWCNYQIKRIVAEKTKNGLSYKRMAAFQDPTVHHNYPSGAPSLHSLLEEIKKE